jgi:sugar O-acyltransferase (sialic acid O-acetyltransferase NeuD family)
LLERGFLKRGKRQWKFLQGNEMLYLYGASGHSKVVIEIAETLSEKIECLIDQNPAIKNILGYHVRQNFPAHLNTQETYLVITIGNNQTRKNLAEANPFRYKTLIHPKSIISTRAKIGAGTVVMAGVSVNSEARIGKHTILNTNCSIDHDCIIENYAHVSPNAALAGNVTVGEGAHVGIGACVIQGIKIGKWSTIGAGAVVIKDVPDYSTVVGNPGRIIKIRDNNS